MKRSAYLSLLFLMCICVKINAQTFSPVTTTGYTLDAIAENTTALATTTGPLDGSNYVMYSAAYGALYSVSNGLPNNGLISNSTSTYQLQSYSGNNVLFVPAGLLDSITLSTPAAFAGLSLLGFATEGNGLFTATVRFTDNSTQIFSNLTYFDWFGGSTSVFAGFDRVSRSTGVPAQVAGNPKMFSVELPITCANRAKLINRVLIQNLGTGPRVCVLAVSGAAAPSFSVNAFPVTCSGGTNGSASVSATGGMLPYTYTWSSTPSQTTALAVSLPIGNYTVLAQDNGGCVFTSTVAVTLSLATQPSLNVSSNIYTICSGGSFTLGVNGAATYTWMNGNNSPLYSPGTITTSAITSLIYTVSGITSSNCYRTGSVNITVNPLPVVSFISPVGPFCNNSGTIALAPFTQPSGGNFSGPAVTLGSFNPAFGAGSYTILYVKTDANNCSNSATTSVQVFSLAAPQLTTLMPQCSNGPSIQFTANPGGGSFSGNGISSTGILTPSIAGAGTHSVVYTFVSGPCTSSTSSNVQINAAPSASVVSTKTLYCKTNPASFLNTSPSGGTLTGTGVSGTTFNPALANVGNNNVIIYTFTDSNGCSDSASVRITVSACAEIESQNSSEKNVKLFPNPNNGSFVLKASEQRSYLLINELGQQMSEIHLRLENNFQSEIKDLGPGIYFILDRDHPESGSSKIMVVK